MKITHSRKAGRGAFTLLELLVVIAIIAVLIGLLFGGISYALRRAHEVQTRHDVSELSKGIIACQTEFNVPYLPSRFILCERQSDYTSVPVTDPNYQLYQDSYQFLTRAFPRLNWNTPQPPAAPTWTGIDWNGDGAYSKPVDLQGQHCLVFWLGGLQSPAAGAVPAGCLGFSTSPTNPALRPSAAGAVNDKRKGPYFPFQSNRLIADSNGMLVYIDYYGKKPFAYFSSFSYWTRIPSASGSIPVPNRYGHFPGPTLLSGLSDCYDLKVSPYAEVLPNVNQVPRYLHGDGFQIISAGPDTVFGHGSSPWPPSIALGSAWTPATAGNSGALMDASNTIMAGKDDISNFYDALLGVPQ